MGGRSMNINDYKKYTISTIASYPLKYRHYLRSLFLETGIAQEGGQISLTSPESIDISGFADINEQLKTCIEADDNSLALFERWEYTKDYKYSALFSIDDFSHLCCEVEESIPEFHNDKLPLFDSLSSPSYLKPDDSIILIKFNLKFEAIHPQTSEELLIRYPVVVALHQKEQILEIRFDSLKRVFMERTESFYADLVQSTIEFFDVTFKIKMIPVDMEFLVKSAQSETSEVRLIAQTMKMANGSYAQLEVGKNEEYILPFIGELKNLLSEYNLEFDKVPDLKEAFEQFIFEKETTSDYPWIELLWENEIKTRSIHVKFTFNYYQKGYCLLQHYFNNILIGMERMNHVVEFIDRIRKNPQGGI